MELYIPSGEVQGDNEKSNGSNEVGLHVPVSFKFVAACIIALHGFCLLRAIRIHTYTYNETKNHYSLLDALKNHKAVESFTPFSHINIQQLVAGRTVD